MGDTAGARLGYCTNVHPGATTEAVGLTLERYAVPVKAVVSPSEPMGIGLWLSATAARELRAGPGALRRFADWLHSHGLYVFTLNGFPYDDFHTPVVKHKVYHPNWATPERLAYTRDLVAVLPALLPAGEREGSISTLPLGWASDLAEPAARAQTVRNLLEIAADLAQLEDTTGTVIHLDLEPEPGCALQRADDAVRFFEEDLFGKRGAAGVGSGLAPDDIARYLRICHDVCHAGVMFEDQAEVVGRYSAAGLRIGKVQISSALRVPFSAYTDAKRDLAVHHLMQFHEPRYLHQTMVRAPAESSTPSDRHARRAAADPAPVFAFYEDLPDALKAVPARAGPTGEWRVHFHVPVHLQRIGLLETTSAEIDICLRAVSSMPHPPRHFEVETYAWNVLPADLKGGERSGPEALVAGIARELAWARSRMAMCAGDAAA